MIDRSVVHGSADDSDNSFFVESWLPTARISVTARQSHVLWGITPHRDVKTLRLGTRLHQREEDNSRFDLDHSASTYPPESGQSRCLSLISS